jgi:hypothetical protein
MPPAPPRLFQFRLKPRLGGMFVRQGFQFIEHDRYVARHADLVGHSMVGIGPLYSPPDL